MTLQAAAPAPTSMAGSDLPRTFSSPLGITPFLGTALPGPKSQKLIERDERVSSPSYTRDYPLTVGRALGCVVEDLDGNRFLDFTAGIAVCATGHCHPKVVAAIEQQAKHLLHICGSDFYYPSMVELMERLARLVPGGKPNGEGKKVLLTNSGAEAVEAGFKLARHHTGRKFVIAFHGAFHGRTMGALSLTSSKTRQRAKFGPLVPMTAHVPYGDVAAIESTLFRYQMEPGEVAAIFVEALQGEGGYIVPPPNFLSDIRKLCDKHGILMVCDEIQSGMGRTGKWWAYEHSGVTPDITLISKGIASGMPIGAVVAREGIMDWPEGAQGSTFGGNPVCCAAAVATIDLVESEYAANAAKMGAILLPGLKKICSEFACIDRARGMGLMCGVDVINPQTKMPDPKFRQKIVDHAYTKGLLLLGCGETAIRFCPALCITEAEVQTGLRLFADTIASLI